MDSTATVLRSGSEAGGGEGTRRPRFIDEKVEALEHEIQALVETPGQRAEVDRLLGQIGEVFEHKACDWEEDVWRAVGRWLITRGHAELWRAMVTSMQDQHSMYSGFVDPSEVPWFIAYGADWWNGHPELVRLRQQAARRQEVR